MTDPTASACTDTYGSRFLDSSTSNHPSYRCVLECICLFSILSSNLPTVLAAKCDGTTCTTLTTDLDVVKECFKGKINTGAINMLSISFQTPLQPLVREHIRTRTGRCCPPCWPPSAPRPHAPASPPASPTWVREVPPPKKKNKKSRVGNPNHPSPGLNFRFLKGQKQVF